jgi:hypothetical protein
MLFLLGESYYLETMGMDLVEVRRRFYAEMFALGFELSAFFLLLNLLL